MSMFAEKLNEEATESAESANRKLLLLLFCIAKVSFVCVCAQCLSFYILLLNYGHQNRSGTPPMVVDGGAAADAWMARNFVMFAL